MNARAGIVVVCVGLVLTAGCHHLTLETGRPAEAEPKTGSHNYFMGGIVGNHTLKVDTPCPLGAAKVHLYRGFVDFLLAFITLGIYTPRSYEIWCATGPLPESKRKARPADDDGGGW